MSTEISKATSRPAARCGPCSDCVVARAGLDDGMPLGPGDPIYTGDRVSAGAAGTLRLTFKDGMRLSMAGGVLCVDAYVYGGKADDDEDIAALSMTDATFAIRSGRIGTVSDAVSVQAGAMSLGLFDAFVAGIAGQDSQEMVTLLPGRDGTLGTVLVHNKVGVATLDNPYHTVRLMGANGLIDKPMSLPSKVVADLFRRALPPEWMAPPAAGNARLEDEVAYSELDDRMLERRFVGAQVFPVDNGPGTPRKDGLLEDAFEGERFRLNDDDPAL